MRRRVHVDEPTSQRVDGRVGSWAVELMSRWAVKLVSCWVCVTFRDIAMSYCPHMYQGFKPYRIFVWYFVDVRRTFRRCEACFSLMRGALFVDERRAFLVLYRKGNILLSIQ